MLNNHSSLTEQSHNTHCIATCIKGTTCSILKIINLKIKLGSIKSTEQEMMVLQHT